MLRGYLLVPVCVTRMPFRRVAYPFEQMLRASSRLSNSPDDSPPPLRSCDRLPLRLLGQPFRQVHPVLNVCGVDVVGEFNLLRFHSRLFCLQCSVNPLGKLLTHCRDLACTEFTVQVFMVAESLGQEWIRLCKTLRDRKSVV